MGIKNKLYRIFGKSSKKSHAVSPVEKKTVGTLKGAVDVNANLTPLPKSEPESYREKQQNFLCIVTVNNQTSAINISKAIDSTLKVWSEVGMKDGDIAVFVKPDCDINRAKKIVLEVLKKEVRRDSTIKWKLHSRVKDDKRMHKRLNLVSCDKQSILSMVDETVVRSAKPGIDFHQSVFTVCDGHTGKYFGELIDISQGGFKLISQTPFKKSTTYYQEIDFLAIKKIKQKILFDAECVYINNTLSNDFFISGFKFSGIHQIELKIIKRFIDLFSKLD